MQGRDRKVIPAGGTVVLEGMVSESLTERSVVVEYPSGKLPFVISNESDHDITIPAKTVITELSAIQTILSHKQSMTRTSESEHSKAAEVAFDFGESPVPPEWKDRTTQKLSCMPEVFALNDTDFGRTRKVKHHIKLSNETPFNSEVGRYTHTT